MACVWYYSEFIYYTINPFKFLSIRDSLSKVHSLTYQASILSQSVKSSLCIIQYEAMREKEWLIIKVPSFWQLIGCKQWECVELLLTYMEVEKWIAICVLLDKSRHIGRSVNVQKCLGSNPDYSKWLLVCRVWIGQYFVLRIGGIGIYVRFHCFEDSWWQTWWYLLLLCDLW